MKIKTLITILTVVATFTLTVRADMFDNFDSYTTQAQLLAAWNGTTPTGTGLQLSQSAPTPVSAPNDVKVTSSASYRIVRNLGAGAVQAGRIDWSFDLFDGNGSRDAASLYSYTGAWGAGLQTTVQMGVYNTGTGGKYMARYSSITGAIYGDGAVATTADGGTGGWFSLTSAASRGTGAWHHMEVLGMADPVNTGKLKLEFYVDGTLGGSLANLNGYGWNFNFATVGIAVSTTGTGGSAFDNISVATVPEPGTFALLGGFALALGVISRRKM